MQNNVVARLLEIYPELTSDDVRSTSMGAGGEDVQLSQKARQLIPWSFECKNQEKFKGIYDIMAQAKGHGTGQPVAILKMNHKEPLAVISADTFFYILGKLHERQEQ